MSKEKFNIENEDWRLQAITTTTKDSNGPSGAFHPAGTPISQISLVNLGEKILSFRVPNVCSLFLDFAHNLSESANENMKEHNFLEEKSKMLKGYVYPENEGDFFQIIEMKMGEIVFSYSALESFANENIPEDYIYETTRNDGKCIEKYNKKQIERAVSLDVKLSEILPAINNINSPKGGSIWNRYANLKDLRDRIIHKKTKDKTSASPDEKSFWSDILNEKNPNFALEVKEIIEHYFKNDEQKPRWLIKFPYK